jgi:hypothetical protein
VGTSRVSAGPDLRRPTAPDSDQKRDQRRLFTDRRDSNVIRAVGSHRKSHHFIRNESLLRDQIEIDGVNRLIASKDRERLRSSGSASDKKPEIVNVGASESAGAPQRRKLETQSTPDPGAPPFGQQRGIAQFAARMELKVLWQELFLSRSYQFTSIDHDFLRRVSSQNSQSPEKVHANWRIRLQDRSSHQGVMN